MENPQITSPENPRVSKIHLIFPALVLFFDILLLGAILVLLLDFIVPLCRFNGGELGAINVNCSLVPGPISMMIEVGANLLLLLFFSIFWLFIPEIVFLIVSIFSYRRVVKIIQNSVGGKASKFLYVLKYSIIVFPILLFLTYGITALKHQNIVKMSRVQSEKLDIQKDLDFQQRYIESYKNVPDRCPDAPSDVYLTYEVLPHDARFIKLTLNFPKGYYSGQGLLLITLENFWDGILSKDAQYFHPAKHIQEIQELSELSSMTIPDAWKNQYFWNIEIPEKRNKYDIYPFYVDQKFIQERGKASFFSNSSTFHYFSKGETVAISPEYIQNGQCLTVAVRDKE